MKPFRPRELLSRLKAVLRHKELSSIDNEVLAIVDLRVDCPPTLLEKEKIASQIQERIPPCAKPSLPFAREYFGASHFSIQKQAGMNRAFNSSSALPGSRK